MLLAVEAAPIQYNHHYSATLPMTVPTHHQESISIRNSRHIASVRSGMLPTRTVRSIPSTIRNQSTPIDHKDKGASHVRCYTAATRTRYQDQSTHHMWKGMNKKETHFHKV